MLSPSLAAFIIEARYVGTSVFELMQILHPLYYFQARTLEYTGSCVLSQLSVLSLSEIIREEIVSNLEAHRSDRYFHESQFVIWNTNIQLGSTLCSYA